MTLQMSLLAAHVPSMCHVEQVPEFQKELVNGLNRMKERIQDLKTEVIVLMSCHFPATFHHYVDITLEHKGILTAVECPDLISDVPYRYGGDEELGQELAEAGKKAGLPIIGVNDPTYIWDYGTVVPLRYLVPDENIPVINLSVCWAASLDETYQYLMNGDFAAAREMLIQYSRIAGVESGGRHLAALLGVLDEKDKAEYWRYGQSSGSGNAILSIVS